MKDNRASTQIVTGFIIFIIIGMALNGVTTEPAPVQTVQIEADCADYTKDGDGDGLNGFIEDTECWDYPYADGNGESTTNLPPQSPVNPSSNYQPYFDLTADFVRLFINIECAGNLAGCIGTNFQWESQFYCFFSNNVMNNDFLSIFNKFYDVAQTLPDDGSKTTYQNLCMQLSPPLGNIPTVDYQSSEPIPQNPAGGGKGGSESPEERPVK